MAERKISDLIARIRVDTSDLDKASQKAKALGEDVKKAGDGAGEGIERGFRISNDQLDRFGSTMTRSVTLPLAAGAAVALRMGTDFETTFTRMQGLAGVAASEVDGLRQTVLDLSGETARSPQELAEALYFIRSAGLEGDVAIQALDASARAAAVGLGETSAVADAVTSAVNSYGSESLSAAQATDVLVAAVREGKGEAEAMAPQLGRLLPIASELGVEFGEVAGGLAYLTRGNGDAAQSATQLQGILQKLIRPSEQARTELAGVGLSADQIRTVVAEQGLLPALQLLDQKLVAGSESFGRVFDDSEAFTGSLALLRGEGEEAAGVIDSVTNSTGDLSQAFAGLEGTDAFRAKQALSELQTAAIEASAQMAPALTNIVSGVGEVVGAFGDLPSSVQTGLLVLGGLAAAMGPVATAAANIKRAIDLVRASSLSLTGTTGAFGAAAVGVGLLTTAFFSARQEAARAQQAIGDIVDAAEAAGKTADEMFREKLARSFAGLGDGLTGRGVDDAIAGLKELGFTVEEIAAGFTGTQEAYDEFRRTVATRALDSDVSWVDDFAKGFETIRRTSRQAEEQQRALQAAQDDLGLATEDTAAATDEQAAAQAAANAAMTEAPAKLGTAAAKAKELRDAYKEADEALNDLTDSVLAGFDADLNYEDALRDFAEANDTVFLAQEDIRINGWTPERQAALDRANQQLERSALALSRAEIARAEAHAEAAGETLNARDKNNLLIGSFLRMAAELEPGSPLRTYLAQLIDDLREAAKGTTVSIDFEVNDEPKPGSAAWAALHRPPQDSQHIWGGGPPPAPAPAPAPSPAPSTPPREWTWLWRTRGPRVPEVPAAPAAVPQVVVPITVNGDPDTATLRRLERIAEGAVRRGVADLTDSMVRAR